MLPFFCRLLNLHSSLPSSPAPRPHLLLLNPPSPLLVLILHVDGSGRVRFSVDTFFFVSGFLVVYAMLRRFKHDGAGTKVAKISIPDDFFVSECSTFALMRKRPVVVVSRGRLTAGCWGVPDLRRHYDEPKSTPHCIGCLLIQKLYNYGNCYRPIFTNFDPPHRGSRLKQGRLKSDPPQQCKYQNHLKDCPDSTVSPIFAMTPSCATHRLLMFITGSQDIFLAAFFLRTPTAEDNASVSLLAFDMVEGERKK